MMRGRVKLYRSKGGFGFIETEDGGPDVFIHISQIIKAGIADDTGEIVGSRVAFGLALRPDGRSMANDVKRLADE